MTRIAPLVLLAVCMICADPALAQDCEPYQDRIGISEGVGARITLDANNAVADDKEAIECALQVAADKGISRVQLQSGDFYLSQLEIVEFLGTLEGRSIALTRLNAIPSVIDCQADDANARSPAFIRFVNGRPSLRTMSINLEASCFDDVELPVAVHFTGLPDEGICGNDLTQAFVDRVVLNGPGIRNGVAVGIGAWAQSFPNSDCRNTLLGTFKLNRSTVSGFERGVVTSMHDSAQVDINFNVFSDTLVGYQMQRSRQNTSVFKNEFNGAPQTDDAYDAIDVIAGFNPPNATSLVVSGNTFNLDASQTLFRTSGVRTWGFNQDASLSMVVKDNSFSLTGNGSQGLYLFDVSNTVTVNNLFSGNGEPVLLIKFDAPEMADNALLGNQFEISPDFATDINVGSGVERTIVGPGQAANVFDLGTGSILTDNLDVTAPD